MERTIKFRGKRVDNDEWFYGSYVKVSEKHGYIIGYFGKPEYLKKEDIHCVKCVCHKVKNETVGQYTGLKDKKGVEVYEGDILGSKNIDGFFCAFKVIWSDYRDGWLADNDDEIYDLLPSRFIYGEVIGNIYENKNLIFSNLSIYENPELVDIK